MPTYSYEESVQWVRNQPEHSELVKLCYLDADNLEAAKRFALSDEFACVKKLLRLNDQPKQLRILDVGCGSGIASYAFVSLGHEVVAIDPDMSGDVGLEATQRLNIAIQNGSISTAQAFAEALPFEDAAFDIVYARQALHHFSDLYQGVAECSRVLKPGGLFLATREHVISDKKQLQEFLSNHILHRLHGGENAHTLNTYLTALKQANFRTIKTFRAFDTVINHFPILDAEIKEWLLQSVENKFGKAIAAVLINFPLIEQFYRHRLSKNCQIPGRLYSFLCCK